MNSLAPTPDSQSLQLLLAPPRHCPHPSPLPFRPKSFESCWLLPVLRVSPPSVGQTGRMEGCLGEESFQMWELNRRLEAYLARVKALEEQNELLSAELGGLRAQAGDASWRARADDELAALRALVDQRWREKRAAEERVAHMETSLGQARERLGHAVKGAREGRLELQQLQAERSGLQERRAALEQRLEGRWQERLRATEQFQLAVEALEQEKQGLQSQIAQVLEGRQQLAHLKMSLSLEVATYRTLLEAENSRLQTPGSGSKASLSFLDPKLELHFPGTPEGRRLGPLLSVLSPTPLSSPLPDTLETPVPGFLKSQELLQTHTPTSASTPIPPTPQAPCPATDAKIRAQDAPLSLPQPRVGMQQVPEAVWAEAKVATPASVLPGPEEPGGKQQEPSPGQSSEDHASLAPALSPDHPKEVDKGSQRYLEEEENVEKGENPEPPRSLEEEGQELPLSAHLQKWEDTVQGGQEPDQETPPGRPEVDSEDEAEMAPRERDSLAGKGEAVEQGELQLTATGKAWSPGEGQPGSPEPKEQRVSAEGASGVGGTEGLQDPEERPEQVGTPGLPAPQGMSEVTEPVLEGEDVAPRDGRASPEVTLGLETAGAEQGREQEAVGLEDPGGLAREEVMEPPLGEEGLEAKRVQGLEGPRKELEEAAAPEPELSTLPRKSRDPLETPRGWEESEPEAPEEAEETFPAETSCCDGSDTPQPRPLSSEGAKEDVKPVLGPPSPRPTESCSPTPIPEDAPGPQPLAEGSQEASWRLAGRAEVLGKVEGEQEDLGSGGIPEGLQEEGEESREESEADELGETLPDSTPLGLYLRSPASPKWDLAGEQRPSPQEETGKEGWGPAVLASEGLGAHPSEEEEGGDEEEERGHDSELSEEFEDLGTEASLLPGVPGEVAEPLGQVPQPLLEPAAWDRDGESDGFADEEESGEEGEEEDEEEGREPGAGRWGAGPSVGSLPALSGPQRGNLQGSETMDVSVPWDDGLRGAASDAPMTALETESQDSTEASGSEEESDAIPLEREGQVPGPLGTLGGVEDTGLEVGDTLGVNGQGPSLKEELEHVNGGVVNGLEQSEGVRQGKPGPPEGDQGSPLEEEEEGGALKTPWAGAPLHLGQGQLLKFSQREGDGDSWSSGED
ncbi:Nestin, partial [Eschrichtius robustus]|nr:Nestin [Eschrichtius robustus]